MLIAFELSMPGKASWNGKWSGEGQVYVRVRTIRKKEGGEGIVEKGCYHYHWEDGWSAAVLVRRVDSTEARKLRRRSAGFCGYDWMVDSIVKHGAIYASHDDRPGKESEGA